WQINSITLKLDPEQGATNSHIMLIVCCNKVVSSSKFCKALVGHVLFSLLYSHMKDNTAKKIPIKSYNGMHFLLTKCYFTDHWMKYFTSQLSCFLHLQIAILGIVISGYVDVVSGMFSKIHLELMALALVQVEITFTACIHASLTIFTHTRLNAIFCINNCPVLCFMLILRAHINVSDRYTLFDHLLAAVEQHYDSCMLSGQDFLQKCQEEINNSHLDYFLPTMEICAPFTQTRVVIAVAAYLFIYHKKVTNI
ncbi:hypothetical protein ACJX0J_038742, partial [Zea mays]